MSGRVDRWARGWWAPQGPRTLGVARGVLALLAGWTLALRGPWDPDAALHHVEDLPASAWAPVGVLALVGAAPPAHATVVAVAAVTSAAAAAALVGLWTRSATTVLALGLLWLTTLEQSFGRIDHGTNLLVLMVLLLPLLPCGDALALDARGRPAPAASWRYAWGVRLLQVTWAALMVSAGWSKVVHGGWRWVASDNLRNVLLVTNLPLPGGTLSPWVAALVERPLLCRGLALGAVVLELSFVAVAFVHVPWVRRGLLAAGVLLVAGFALLLRLPQPITLLTLAVFVDWDGHARPRAG